MSKTRPAQALIIQIDRILDPPSSPAAERPAKVCTHCRDPIILPDKPIVWHHHMFHVWCAKKLLIVAQMTKDELVQALAGSDEASK